MIKRLIQYSCFLSLLFCSLALSAQASKGFQVSVLTCSPGTELYSTFGHTAIRIVDSSNQTDLVYNFGTFDFNDPNFYSKFTRGKLAYFLSVASLPEFLYEYQLEGRKVTEQILNIDSSSKRQLATELAQTLITENRFYQYDFLYNNCTSKIRDLLIKEGVLNTNYHLVSKPASFRNFLHQYLQSGNHHWSQLGIDLLLGSPIDKIMVNKHQMFLPDYLMNGIDSNQTLVASKRVLVSPNQPSLSGGNGLMPFFVFSGFSILYILLTLVKVKWVTRLIRWLDAGLFFITGAIGILLLFMWFGTDHKSCAYNYNLLWALPTHFMASFFVWNQTSAMKNYFLAATMVHALTIICWFFLPQELNLGFAPIAILLLTRSVHYTKKGLSK